MPEWNFDSVTTLIMTVSSAISVFLTIAIAFFLTLYPNKIAKIERMIRESQKEFKDARSRKQQRLQELRNFILGNSKEPVHLETSNQLPGFFFKGLVPDAPIPLGDIVVTKGLHPSPMASLKMKSEFLPYADSWRYDNLSQAILALESPTNFFDGFQYRLLAVSKNRLEYSPNISSYFNKINFGEYLYHEAAVQMVRGKKFRSRNRERLLKEFKSPSDYVVHSGINTLTLIVKDGKAQFLWHRRSNKTTMYDSASFHVIPAGEFQPASQNPRNISSDLDIWKNIMREYSEEVAGNKEHDSTTEHEFRYDARIFKKMEEFRRSGAISPFYFGAMIDRFTFQVDILTVVVFTENAFNDIFPNVLSQNTEGTIENAKDSEWGRPFDDQNIESAMHPTDGSTLQQAVALLVLAKRHSEQLIESVS